MAWRCVHISRPARLKLKDQQLLIMQDDDTIILPLEDIACCVLDTPQVTISGALLSVFATMGVACIIPDEKHHPAGMLLPFHRHYAQADIIQLQIGASQPLRKRLWQALVTAKINNQAAILAARAHKDAKKLQSMAGLVTSGDKENIEAQAARFYWSRLFQTFLRADSTDKRNGLLNYGYAILRAALARACVAAGLIPSLGLHHASRTNAFNLVDDLIEPFRPSVDHMVVHYLPEGDTATATLEDRRFMAGILTQTVRIGQDNMTILAATETIATDLVKALEHNSAALLRLPTPLGKHP
ncbi:type II CRISPR-associated endonuclease Cas1 [Bombella pollinis]|uniref:CRISPR-associated endonuclease Cas1 n=1 Tax=Bombella pollinis TaxID=2967337 RepID=A0ABT3WQV7_9PROT|nr:type II CRISPR-associated endonuclease Cas1 [Bombella pollinis]MCX5620102.1 type II CRISPR-associated endonuclease Cas1 [Bombella pollinis]